MAVHLSVEWINIEMYFFRRMANRIEQVMLRIEISQNELARNIDGLYRQVKQFAKHDINDTIAYCISFLTLQCFIDKVIVGIIISKLNALLFVIIVEDARHHIYLLDGGKVIVQLQPGIAPQLFYLLVYLLGLHLRIMIPRHQQCAFQKVIVSGSPFGKIIAKVAEVQLVDQEFNSFLYLFTGGAFPKIFQVRDDGFAERNYLFANAVVYILIRVIDQVEEG